MAEYSFLTASAVIACCCFVGCHVIEYPSDGSAGSIAEGGTANPPLGNGGSGAGAGRTGAGGQAWHGSGSGAAGEGAAGEGAAGDSEGGSAGQLPAVSGGAPNGMAGSGVTELEVGGEGGKPALDCNVQQVTCKVLSEAAACEFLQFADATATVACGQTVTVGIAHCGQCGEVAVELYFDGRSCWQGLPDCTFENLSGKFLYPHSP